MSLDDVPVDAVGISWEQWMEQQRERIFAEARAKRRAASGPSAHAGSPMLQEENKRSMHYKPNRIQARNENRPE
jgi:hypothetical protein